jgi:hypothetical protein
MKYFECTLGWLPHVKNLLENVIVDQLSSIVHAGTRVFTTLKGNSMQTGLVSALVL